MNWVEAQVEILHQGPKPLGVVSHYFSVDIFPVAAPSYLLVTPRDSRKLPPELLETISLKCATTSLRTIAEEYGVSYESVRRACLAVERAGGGRPSKSQVMS